MDFRDRLHPDDALRTVLRRLRGNPEAEDASRVLDEQLRPRLTAYFQSRPIGAEDAEDLVQKTLARVFRGIGGLENDESFIPWLFAIARNVRRTAEEKRRREGEPVALPENVPDPRSRNDFEEEELDRNRREVLSRAIERLPARQRQCLGLRVRDGLSYEEIANTLRLSVHTVRNHLAAARESLRELVRSEEQARRA